MRHRYPFEALHWLRHQRVDREARQVSESAARTARARAHEVRTEAARQQIEHRIEEVASAERARLEEGQARVGDLARAGAWQLGAEAERRAKVEAEQSAREACRVQAAASAVARRALAAASSHAELIDSHRLEWRAEREVSGEQVEEEAALEQWTAKRFPPRG